MPTGGLGATRAFHRGLPAVTLVWALLCPAVACHWGTDAQAPNRSPQASTPVQESPLAADRVQEDSCRDLATDERHGGHTLERHVGKSDEELRARLARDTRISAASTYTDRATAERVVGETLAEAASRIARWVAREGRRPNLVLDYTGSREVVIGRSIRRGRDTAEPCTDAVVVLRWNEARGDYYVLTSYPEVRR